MNSLETQRLTIRNFQFDDWQALLTIIVEYQASAMAAYDRPWPTAEDEIKGVVEWFANGDSYLAVCLKATERLIGFVGISPGATDAERIFELGYVFDAAYQGQGYATEACQAILAWAFGELHAEKVMAGTAMVNQSSRRLLERLGFQKMGEEMVSFRKDEAGKPVEFLGYNYSLTKKISDQSPRLRAT